MSLLVFDSGIGGLGVVRALSALLPDRRIDYLADNALFPYGDQPDAALAAHVVALLASAVAVLRPQAVVVACNTASTIALAAVRAAVAVPVVGCVPPVKPAAAATRTGHVGLLATPATVRRPYLQDLIEAHAAGVTVHALGAPGLAALAEMTAPGAAPESAALRAEVAPLFAKPGAAAIDAIALGCTHYSFLRPALEALYPGVAFFDPALPVARRTVDVVRGLDIAAGRGCAYATAPMAASLAAHLAAVGYDAAVDFGVAA